METRTEVSKHCGQHVAGAKAGVAGPLGALRSAVLMQSQVGVEDLALGLFLPRSSLVRWVGLDFLGFDYFFLEQKSNKMVS